MTKIVSSYYVLGRKKQNLSAICKENPSWDYDKLLKKTGISNRYILDDRETPEDLSIRAGKRCMSVIKNKAIDGIIYVSQSPSSPLPTRACILQDALNIPLNSLAFDVNQGCSGFIYALSLANSLIKNKEAKRVLIICTDYYSKYISDKDRTSRPIFSDAAAAVILESSDKTNIGPFIFKTDGSGAKHLTVRKREGVQELFMDGPEVLKFSLNLVPKATYELLDKASMKLDDIDMFIFHQASAVVLDKLQKKLNIDDKKWVKIIQNIGNTVSATIPIAINILDKQNKFKENKKFLLMGFGVGLSVGGCIVST